MIDLSQSTNELLAKHINYMNPLHLDNYTLYVDALFSWQKTNNIIGTKNKEYFIKREIQDCLVIRNLIPNGTILDVGTGGGIPGIIFAISNRNNKYILLERSRNYLNFLEQIKIRLDLNNVNLINCDFFDYKPEEKVDAIILKNFSNKQISNLKYAEKFILIKETISKNIGKNIPFFMITGSNSLQLLDNPLIKNEYRNNVNIIKIDTPFFKTNRYLVEHIS